MKYIFSIGDFKEMKNFTIEFVNETIPKIKILFIIRISIVCKEIIITMAIIFYVRLKNAIIYIIIK